MLSPQALLKGLVSYFLPAPAAEDQDTDRAIRLLRYREAAVMSMVRKAHLLADEGSYFACNNAQTGVIEGVQTAFVATAPTLIVDNNEDPNSPQAKTFFLDYIDLAVTVAGITATAVQGKAFGIVIDKGPRYSSGGTDISTKIVNVNMRTGSVPKLNAYFGALTASAASKQARTIVGERIYRLPVTATTAPDVLGDRLKIESGSVEPETTVQLGTTGALMANVFQAVQKVPALEVPPGYSLLLYTWDLVSGGTYGTGTTWLPEFAGWAR